MKISLGGVLVSAALVGTASLAIFGYLETRDPLGPEYAERVRSEIANCIDNEDRCVGGSMTLRSRQVVPLKTADDIYRLRVYYEYNRTGLVKSIASVKLAS